MYRIRLFPIISHLYLAAILFNPRIPILWSILTGLIFILLLSSQKAKFNALQSQPFIIYLSLYLIYYLLSCFLWSSDKFASLHSLSTQTPLFLIPLLFILLSPSASELKLIKRAWVNMVLLVLLIELCYSCWRYFHNSDLNMFFTDQLTALTRTHSTYFSMYLLVTFAFIAQAIFPIYRLKSLFFSLAILLFISLIAYLIGSKIVLSYFLIAWGILSVQIIKFLPVKYSLSILAFCCLVLFLWVLAFKVNLNRYRGITDWRPKNYSDIRAELDQREQNDSTRWTTISFRSALWESGLTVWRKNLIFGVGVGDMQDSMLKEYKRRNFHRAIQDRSKLHNTFLDIGVESGIIGMILFFLAIFFSAVRHNFATNNRTNLLLILALFLSMQVESYTARLHYQLFLSLLLCILSYKSNSKSV